MLLLPSLASQPLRAPAAHPVLPSALAPRQAASARPVACHAWADLLDFEKWAPRSSRAWRLPPKPASEQTLAERLAEESADEAALEELNRRIAAAAEGRGMQSFSDGASSVAEADAPSSSPAPTPLDALNDSDLSLSLSRRIAEVTGSPQPTALTGMQLRQWIVAKYGGKTYDLSVVRRQFPGAPGGRPIIALNVMWVHLEQASFPMTEAEYMAKLDNIAVSLTAWGQAEVVRDFFLAPAKSKNGLPGRRPVVGNAISLRLNLPDNVIAEWFGA